MRGLALEQRLERSEDLDARGVEGERAAVVLPGASGVADAGVEELRGLERQLRGDVIVRRGLFEGVGEDAREAIPAPELRREARHGPPTSRGR